MKTQLLRGSNCSSFSLSFLFYFVEKAEKGNSRTLICLSRLSLMPEKKSDRQDSR